MLSTTVSLTVPCWKTAVQDRLGTVLDYGWFTSSSLAAGDFRRTIRTGNLNRTQLPALMQPFEDNVAARVPWRFIWRLLAPKPPEEPRDWATMAGVTPHPNARDPR
ncbi:hypothetical protein GCM10010358_54920 [Streptomyces minutiscleroticus]|uniref:Uncharacterized protein n=1 Tax=Streptomyces minutiscleroticus TaxID=68238 RepID=A0A918NT64_9ACTN|nr:hypothetical protein GCM10010358_54920 [Streptomyces minutiscleroticus]